MPAPESNHLLEQPGKPPLAVEADTKRSLSANTTSKPPRTKIGDTRFISHNRKSLSNMEQLHPDGLN